MKISKSLKDFKNTHKKGLNQVIYKKMVSKSTNEITNLINNFLYEKIALYLNPLRKEK